MTAQVDQPTPLRVGLIIDSFVQPRWVRRAIEKMLATGIASLEIVVKVDQLRTDERSLLYKVYESIDRRLFEADALELTSIEDLFDSKTVNKDLEATNLDVLVNFGPAELNNRFAHAAKHGVWFYSFGNPPGFAEVLHQTPVTHSSLRGRHEDKEYVVYESVAPTLSRFSVRLNTNSCYWKSAAFVARGLADLHQERVANATAIANNVSTTSATNAAMAQMLLKLSGRAAARAMEKFSSFEQWVLAYRIDQGEFRYLVPPADRFWADPFPLKVGGKYYIFFEDYVNSAGRAHISVVELDQNGIVNGPTEVLKLDCHLSYPFVFEWRGDYYMIPESGERNVVELYRAVSFPYKWEPEKVLLEASSPLDATVIEVEGTWWMFVNIEEEGVAVNWDELHLYYSESLLGPWKPHARNPIVSDVRSARPAGRLFWSENVLYRPSQDSSLRYGYATTISKVTKLDPRDYNETEVLKILPDWDKDIIGIHTVNLVEDITVIDCLAKRRRRGSFKPRPPKGSLDLLSSANMEMRSEASPRGLSSTKK
ncbi:MAG TPA: hypothetical protein VGJ37_10925 [Pyrinomonadaceae bacterium]|jgi:hypothetical protein